MVHEHLPGGSRAKATSVFFKDINTQTEQITLATYHGAILVLARDRETKFVSGPRVSKGGEPLR